MNRISFALAATAIAVAAFASLACFACHEARAGKGRGYVFTRFAH